MLGGSRLAALSGLEDSALSPPQGLYPGPLPESLLGQWGEMAPSKRLPKESWERGSRGHTPIGSCHVAPMRGLRFLSILFLVLDSSVG